MLLILYLYLIIQLHRAGSRTKANYEKLIRENTQLLLDADRMMREIADSFQTKRVKSNADETSITHVFGVPLYKRGDIKGFSKGGYVPKDEQSLEDQLKQCLEEENFELAAVIRDRINKKNAEPR